MSVDGYVSHESFEVINPIHDHTQAVKYAILWWTTYLHIILIMYTVRHDSQCYICSLQISSTLLPETNLTCTADNIRHLSQVMKVYETLQGAANEVEVIAPTADEWRGFTAPHYQCAWINSRALNNCSTLPQSSLLMALDRSYHCSDISGNYNLCSNV